MPDIESVRAARKRVATAYNSLLKGSFGTKLSEQGRDKPRERMPKIDPATGTWADSGDRGKPPAWIVTFRWTETNRWTAGKTETQYANRIAGGFNLTSPLQGVLARVLPVVEREAEVFETHPYWEWIIAFAFAGRATEWAKGSSGTAIDFDPDHGVLSAPIARGGNVAQPYVDAGIFRLVPPEDRWSADVPLRYDVATQALAAYVHFDIATADDLEGQEPQA